MGGGLIHDLTHSYNPRGAFALVNVVLGLIPFLVVPALRAVNVHKAAKNQFRPEVRPGCIASGVELEKFFWARRAPSPKSG